jgi:RNA polymerase sigma factor (sigma-70 family)
MSAITKAPCGQLPCDADAAIRELYSSHAKALRRYVERFCPDRASADDIVQETFIRAWRHLPQLSADDRPIRPWLFRVARNLLIDADRAARSRPMAILAQPAEEAGTDSGLDQVLVRRSRAPVARSPHRAGGNLLPRGQPGHRGPPARHTARHGQITAALRTARAAPAAA